MSDSIAASPTPAAFAAPKRMRHSLESRQRLVALVLEGLAVPKAAERAGFSRAHAYRLWRRFRSEGPSGLLERPSTPKRQPRRLAPELEALICAARLQQAAGPHQLAGPLGYSASTIYKVLRRHGLSRLPGRGEREPDNRYEFETPGGLLHIDTKKLGRFYTPGKRALGPMKSDKRRAGFEHLHVAVDDHSRAAYAEVLPSATSPDCAAFLRRAVAWLAEQGVFVERVMTDNAKAYGVGRAFKEAVVDLDLKHLFIKPYRPRTNGKAEALIKILLREWARRFVYPSSRARLRALPGYLRWYNRRRPHGSLKGKPPFSRLAHVSHLCERNS